MRDTRLFVTGDCVEGITRIRPQTTQWRSRPVRDTRLFVSGDCVEGIRRGGRNLSPEGISQTTHWRSRPVRDIRRFFLVTRVQSPDPHSCKSLWPESKKQPWLCNSACVVSNGRSQRKSRGFAVASACVVQLWSLIRSNQPGCVCVCICVRALRTRLIVYGGREREREREREKSGGQVWTRYLD